MALPGRLGEASAVAHAAAGQEKAARQVTSLAPKSEPAKGQRVAAGGPATKQGPIVIRAETVDGQGTHIPAVGLGFALSYAPGRAPEFSKMQSIASDDEGKVSVQFDRFLPGERVIYASVWAIQGQGQRLPPSLRRAFRSRVSRRGSRYDWSLLSL